MGTLHLFYVPLIRFIVSTSSSIPFMPFVGTPTIQSNTSESVTDFGDQVFKEWWSHSNVTAWTA
jgi:hypothetical protein